MYMSKRTLDILQNAATEEGKYAATKGIPRSDLLLLPAAATCCCACVLLRSRAARTEI